MIDPSLTLAAALLRFRRENGLNANAAEQRFWTCRVGPVTLHLPNFAWRRRAIAAHDAHHVLTGYPCTLRGEMQMAAWEFAAGPVPHLGAALFCLPLALLGLVCFPRQTVAAFRAGRRSVSLHGSALSTQTLRTPVRELRRPMSLRRSLDLHL